MNTSFFCRIAIVLFASTIIGCGDTDAGKKTGDTSGQFAVDTALNRADSIISDTAVSYPGAGIKPPKPGEKN